MKVFLCIGQSNMAGPCAARWNESDDAGLKGVFLLNGEDKWEKAVNPFNRYSTVKLTEGLSGISPASTFSCEMKKAFPDEEIGIISNARGASKIASWQKGEWLYNEAVRRVKAGYPDKRIDGILWLQGEQDVVEKSDYENYAEKLSALIHDIREDLGGSDIPFIACEIWENFDQAKDIYKPGIIEVNRQIIETVKKTENCEMIFGNGELEHVVGDEVHFDSEGMRELGRRFAKKYLEVWGK
ncbi:MAG: hypothetical protein IJZ03_04155 [Clostridia bacterium]|nr:hypothetical protein [Clostridia bacterium]